ncbi:MAG: dipeptidase [Clostridiales bacterium]|nr:dipeptidase [Clostridiales bacterium]MCF8023402.1 dipeptidase [Clostridiales bacterium]
MLTYKEKQLEDKITIDAHCDTISVLDNQSIRSTKGHFDLQRMIRGNVWVQFFAVFVSPVYKGRELERGLELIDRYYSELEKEPGIEPVDNIEKLIKCIQTGNRAGILTVEGGDLLKGNIYILRILHRLGVRCMNLTWNYRNDLADGILEKHSNGGLSDFGIYVVQEMNRLGMIIDVSHLSEKGFWDVIEISSLPVIASHSNAKVICDNPRNLNDEQIKALVYNGGVIGLNFVPDFVDPDYPSVSSFLKHVDYIASLVGTGGIGLGSDFDGVDRTIDGLEDVAKIPVLKEALIKRGYSMDDVGKIMGGNFFRVLQHVI